MFRFTNPFRAPVPHWKMSSRRALYVPPNQRKKKPERFHGAFTGGFSAGYFNTVDTKEGWKPSNDTSRTQTVDDFMDEQDHHEWGGPTKVRQDYATNTNATDASSSAATVATRGPSSSLDSLFRISHQTVGPRLLRKLGYRQGGKAFVPGTAGDERDNNGDDDNAEQRVLLSRKKLRKIELQQHRIRLPPPKLDQCGLGFEPHKDAPEFQQYKQKRQQLARERAEGSARDVYRASHLTKNNNDDDGEKDSSTNKKPSRSNRDGGEYLSYEAAEDFVGSRSVGGFALRDDEDDAYDAPTIAPGGKASTLVGEEYNLEVYEHDSDDDQDHGHQVLPSTSKAKTTSNVAPHNDNSVLGGLFDSWANRQDPNSTSKKKKGIGLTSDGRPPVKGFVLGGSMDVHKKRYPGPDIPRDYRIRRHEFGENENPLVFQTLARAEQLLQANTIGRDTRQRETVANLPPLPTSTTLKPPAPTILAGNQFAGLATAMKNRFTTSKTSNDHKGNDTTTPRQVGLYQPQAFAQQDIKNVPDPPKQKEEVKKPITLHRTTQSFVPHPLVCKRFGVPVPKQVVSTGGRAAQLTGTGRMTEASYFEKEILSTAMQQQGKDRQDTAAKKLPQQDNQVDAEEDKDGPPEGVERPAMEKLKSIFEPQSESEESSEADTDLDSVSDKSGTAREKSNATSEALILYDGEKERNQRESRTVEYNEAEEDNGNSSSDFSDDSSERHRKDRKRKKQHRSRRRRRKRSPSPNNDDDYDSSVASDENRRRKKERKRKHEKKRRKKRKSSHRKRQKKETS